MSEADNFEQKRRHETRLYGSYPLRVRVKIPKGQVITLHTLADNVCSGGLYFQLPQALPIGQHIFALIHLPSGIRIAARGQILRNENQPHGLTGMAIRFSQTRLFSVPCQSTKK
jgi:hypothetical protein